MYLTVKGSSIDIIFYLIALVLGFYVGIVLTIKRLRDLGKTPWLTLLFFVPIISFFFWLYLLLAPGVKTENNSKNTNNTETVES